MCAISRKTQLAMVKRRNPAFAGLPDRKAVGRRWAVPP